MRFRLVMHERRVGLSRHAVEFPSDTVIAIVSKTSRLRIAAGLAVRWAFSLTACDG